MGMNSENSTAARIAIEKIKNRMIYLYSPVDFEGYLIFRQTHFGMFNKVQDCVIGPSCGHIQSLSCCDYLLNKDKTTTRSNASRDWLLIP